MPALIAGIHVFSRTAKTWMAGTSPAMKTEWLSFPRVPAFVAGVHVFSRTPRRPGHDEIGGQTVFRFGTSIRRPERTPATSFRSRRCCRIGTVVGRRRVPDAASERTEAVNAPAAWR
jgi:hypothetical protein